jgi:hypothetical protein
VSVWLEVRAKEYHPFPRSVTVGVMEAKAAPFLDAVIVSVNPVFPVTWSLESAMNTILSLAVDCFKRLIG